MAYVPLVIAGHLAYITVEYYRWVNFNRKGEVSFAVSACAGGWSILLLGTLLCNDMSYAAATCQQQVTYITSCPCRLGCSSLHRLTLWA